MITIIGAGAMGGMLASKLSAAGLPVTLVDVSEQLVSAIQSNGLTVETKSGSAVHRIPATTNPHELGAADVVVFFVKAQHTSQAAKAALPLVNKNTIIVSLQNGWGNADVLAETFPAEQIVVGITYHSATVTGLGKVAHTGEGATFLGPYVDGQSLDRAAAWGDLLAQAGVENTVTSKVKTEVWKKLILNAATLPTSALTGLTAGNLGQPGIMLNLVDQLAAEAVKVAQALGHEIELDERLGRIHTILNNAGKGKASMLQDVEANRKTEIEVINAAVIRAAEPAGIDVPLNKAMVAMIEGLERSWRQ